MSTLGIDEEVGNRSTNDDTTDQGAGESSSVDNKRERSEGSRTPLEDRRLNEQSFLILNYDYLKKVNLDKEYGSFFKLRGDPATVVNKITSQQFDDAFLKIKHSDLSRLTPYIRLFKVFYDDEGNETEAAELKFDEYTTKQSVSNVREVGIHGKQTLKRNIEDITDVKAGRGAGVGLKKFEWTYGGSNMEERTNNIDANMTLFFQTVQDLTKVRWARINEDGVKLQASFLDLVAPVSKFNHDEEKEGINNFREPRTHKDTFFRIKAMIGWSEPGPQDPDISDELREAVKNTRVLMHLTLKEHELNFNENGTIELDINFHAATNGMLLEPESNVIAPTGEKKEQIREASTAKSGQELGKDIIKEKIENPDKREQGETESRLKKDLQKLKDGIQDKNEFIREEKTDMYARLLKKIIDDNAIYTLNGVDPEFIGKVVDETFIDETISDALTEKELSNITTGGTEKVRNEQGQLVRKKTGEARDAGYKRKKEIQKSLSIKEWQGSAGAVVREVKRGINKEENIGDFSNKAGAGEHITNRSLDENGNTSIKYFYMGDLIDAALSTFHENNSKSSKRLKFILGDLHFINPYTGDPDLINLADIPVSFQFFFDWFIDTIIKTQKERYLAKYFIEDVFQNLIGKILEGDFLGGILKQKAKISMSNFSFPAKDGKDQLLTTAMDFYDTLEEFQARIESQEITRPAKLGSGDAGAVVEGGYSTGEVSELQKGGQNLHIKSLDSITPARSAEDVKNSIDYLLIYPTNVSAPYLDSTTENAEQRDMAGGIYWFNIGNDRGILRDMKFKRRDQPKAREARITDAEVSRFARLREVYNAQIRVHGNPFFLPGDLIFVNPSVVGFGNAENKVARNSGLVGYYQIITVESVIERGNFETILNTNWISAGTGEGGWHRDGNGQKGGYGVPAKPSTSS